MAFQFVDSTKILEKNMGKFLFFQKLILAYYKPIVKNEVKLANINSNQNVLCIGGGYFPCTAILFHKLSGGATVVVLDNDIDAVNSSKKLVEKLGFSQKVIVKHTDGLESSAQGFDVVHVAMQVSPKEQVFNILHDSMNENSKILIRTPKQHLERGYQPFKQIADKWVKQTKYSNIERTLLYVK